MAEATTHTCLAIREADSVRILTDDRDSIQKAVLAFIDTMTTTSGQATYYDSKNAQAAAVKQIHDAVWAVNRGLYGAMLALPGVTDHNIQLGVMRLLDEPFPDNNESLLTRDEENALICDLSRDIRVQRLFKLFGWFKNNRINNRRVRRLVLNSILGSPKLGFWAVKYRHKLRVALRHAWGERYATVIREILSKTPSKRTERDKKFLRQHVDKYIRFAGDRVSIEQPYEAVCFILGGTRTWKLKIIKAFHEAKTDLEKGRGILPREVLEGIRGRHHPDIPASSVLKLSKATMTATDKLRVQKAAKRGNVKVALDPESQDIVGLYVYALQSKMTDEIREALVRKAKKIAGQMPVTFKRVGIVIDNSASMYGTDAQKNRPLAIGLAMKDVLVASAEHAVVKTTNMPLENDGLTSVAGSTSLAEALLDVIDRDEEFDAIYIITDGYENAPAGRMHEVLTSLRRIGFDVPVFQVTPVMASESAGIRAISSHVAAMPVTRPEGIALSSVRAMIDQGQLEQGIKGLVECARPQLESGNG